MSHIQTVINNKRDVKVLVIGDVILDQYLWTHVSRVSPEAPVPVCRVDTTSHVLGGAGNVVNNLKVLGASVSVASIIGKDTYGSQIQDLLQSQQIDTQFLGTYDNVASICKARVVAGGQQVCRLDYESQDSNASLYVEDLINAISTHIGDYQCVVISDYNKGVVSHELCRAVIDIANEHQVPVIVDPKHEQVSKYAGATYITPNMAEFKLMAGGAVLDTDQNIESVAKRMLEDHDLDNILLTRSADGMSLFNATETQHFPTSVSEVVDITGAGDTVVAALAYGVALGLDQATIIAFANSAAGVVVSKVGTSNASLDEIQAHDSV